MNKPTISYVGAKTCRFFRDGNMITDSQAKAIWDEVGSAEWTQLAYQVMASKVIRCTQPERPKNAVVILEVMWDWRNVTSSAGYREKAPPHFRINPNNHSGRRLHKWLADYPGFIVTNACPQLVTSAKGRGTPDREWLNGNLRAIDTLAGIDLLLVCGSVAQATYDRASVGEARIIELPHPAARFWSKQGIELVHHVIKTCSHSVRIIKRDGCFWADAIA